MSEDLIDVFVETPQGSRKKYEWDPERKALRLDRRLFSATVYPADYGFMPETKGHDGEALDVLVVTQEPTFPGCWVTARPIGVFWIAYERKSGSGEVREAKIIAVPEGDPTWNDVKDLHDLAPHLLDEISHFFEVYKTLEPGRTPRPDGYDGRSTALSVIAEARTEG